MRMNKTFPWRWFVGMGAVLAFLWMFACGVRLDARQHANALLPLEVVTHVLLVMSGVFLVFVLRESLLAVWRTRACVQQLQRLSHSPEQRVRQIAARVAPVTRLRQMPDIQPYAVCAGLWLPTIYLSDGLIATLSDQALLAAIAHEEAHRRRRDPLRLLGWRIAQRVLGQSLSSMVQRAEVRAEVRADWDARLASSTAALAGALLVVLRASLANPADPAALRYAPMRLDGAIRTSVVLDERLRYLALPVGSPLPQWYPHDMTVRRVVAHSLRTPSLYGFLVATGTMLLVTVSSTLPLLTSCLIKQ